jgi:hypothetical protein
VTAGYDYSHTTWEKARNAAARNAGYRDWRHLILATMNMPADDVAPMTGYSKDTIYLWRRKYVNIEQSPDTAVVAWEQANPTITSKDPRSRGFRTVKISVGLDRRHTTAMRELLAPVKTSNIVVTGTTIAFIGIDAVAFMEKLLDGIEPQWRMNDDVFWHARLATITDENERRAVLLMHIRRLVIEQIERS